MQTVNGYCWQTPPSSVRFADSFSLRAKSRLRRLRSDTRLRAQPLRGSLFNSTSSFLFTPASAGFLFCGKLCKNCKKTGVPVGNGVKWTYILCKHSMLPRERSLSWQAKPNHKRKKRWICAARCIWCWLCAALCCWSASASRWCSSAASTSAARTPKACPPWTARPWSSRAAIIKRKTPSIPRPTPRRSLSRPPTRATAMWTRRCFWATATRPACTACSTIAATTTPSARWA